MLQEVQKNTLRS